jgi:predicted Holliday junction resolvase-like endonuclease
MYVVGENRYSRFLYTTVGFIVFDTLYNGAVAYGAIAAYRE